MEGGGSAGGVGGCAVSREDAVQNVIPPTTIVCLPSAIPAPILQTAAQPGVVSSSAVPYLALTTSTPVRALPTKPKVRLTLMVGFHCQLILLLRSINSCSDGEV